MTHSSSRPSSTRTLTDDSRRAEAVDLLVGAEDLAGRDVGEQLRVEQGLRARLPGRERVPDGDHAVTCDVVQHDLDMRVEQGRDGGRGRGHVRGDGAETVMPGGSHETRQ